MPSTRWSSVPTPPEAMTGTGTASDTARVSAMSKPDLVPSRSIEVSRISPAPRAAMRRAQATASSPVARRALLVARRDVEKAELVSALAVVDPRLLDGIAGVDEIDEIDALDDAAILDVEAGDQALLQ